MKKFLVSLLVVVLVGVGVAGSKRADIILALAKYKTSQKYADVAPTREIPWQQGPTEQTSASGEQPPNI
ncbi:MAG: sulfatase, partial [Halieaceae bacterium]|nr:sulfatase [Halieaceae bacterium]